MLGRVRLGRLPRELELELAVPEGVRDGRSGDRAAEEGKSAKTPGRPRTKTKKFLETAKAAVALPTIGISHDGVELPTSVGSEIQRPRQQQGDCQGAKLTGRRGVAELCRDGVRRVEHLQEIHRAQDHE